MTYQVGSRRGWLWPRGRHGGAERRRCWPLGSRVGTKCRPRWPEVSQVGTKCRLRWPERSRFETECPRQRHRRSFRAAERRRDWPLGLPGRHEVSMLELSGQRSWRSMRFPVTREVLESALSLDIGPPGPMFAAFDAVSGDPGGPGVGIESRYRTPGVSFGGIQKRWGWPGCVRAGAKFVSQKLWGQFWRRSATPVLARGLPRSVRGPAREPGDAVDRAERTRQRLLAALAILLAHARDLAAACRGARSPGPRATARPCRHDRAQALGRARMPGGPW
jgi:hypothetical protein